MNSARCYTITDIAVRLERCGAVFFSFQEGQISHRAGTDEREMAAEEEEKLGSKVYALNKSPSSVHSELDAMPYNSDLDSPHKRQNSFELHMLHGALQVNPESAVTSRSGPGEGDPPPVPSNKIEWLAFY